MYLDYDLDESYTPQTVTIRAGSAYDDLKVRQDSGNCEMGCGMCRM